MAVPEMKKAGSHPDGWAAQIDGPTYKGVRTTWCSGFLAGANFKNNARTLPLMPEQEAHDMRIASLNEDIVSDLRLVGLGRKREGFNGSFYGLITEWGFITGQHFMEQDIFQAYDTICRRLF